MPTVMNFDKRKISLMAFTSREDFREFMQKMDFLFDQKGQYPKFYMLTDSETKQEDILEIQQFIQKKLSETDDIEMIKRNLDKGRFPEVTG
jgi:hypothetical protein